MMWLSKKFKTKLFKKKLDCTPKHKLKNQLNYVMVSKVTFAHFRDCVELQISSGLGMDLGLTKLAYF